MNGVSVIEGPAALVSAADAKLWAPVLAGESDARIAALLAAAQAQIERGWIGRAFGRQTLEMARDAFPCGIVPRITLPFPPAVSVSAIGYVAPDGEALTLSPSDYELIGKAGSAPAIALKPGRSWPATADGVELVRIRWVAGYEAEDPALLPARHACVMAAAELASLSTRDAALASEKVEGVSEQRFVVSEVASVRLRRKIDHLLEPYRVFR